MGTVLKTWKEMQEKLFQAKPWLREDPDNPCKEFRDTGKHCRRCPFNPVCND